MIRLSLLCLCLGIFGANLYNVNGQIANATVTSETYYNGTGGYYFYPIDGDLSDIISEFKFEVVVTGLGFGEGPKWIQDCSYDRNGYMLIADQYSNCIWRYWKEDGEYQIECIREIDGEQPNGIGWNLNYPDEIFVALQAGNGVVRLNLTADGLPELDRWNQSAEGYKLWYVNDVIMDSQGNAYFTTYPWNTEYFFNRSGEVVTGAYKIPRDTMEPELIEMLNYGQNGIAMTIDDYWLVYSNTEDYPAGIFNSGDSSQVNYTNLYLQGYYNTGNRTNNFTANSGFYFSWMENWGDYFTSVSVADGSAFDFEGNLWQSVVTTDGAASGWLTILDEDGQIVGVIDFTDTGYGPTNVAKGMDGYMYITLTQWAGDCSAGEPGWGCGGILGRVPLTNYLTSDGSNEYVLNCTSVDTTTTTATPSTTTVIDTTTDDVIDTTTDEVIDTTTGTDIDTTTSSDSSSNETSSASGSSEAMETTLNGSMSYYYNTTVVAADSDSAFYQYNLLSVLLLAICMMLFTAAQ